MFRGISLFLLISSLTGISPVMAGKKPASEPDKYLPFIRSLRKKNGNRKISHALNNRALLSYRLKKYGEAMYIWYEAVQVDPLWWEPYYNMGMARVAEKRMKDAAGYFFQAVKVDRSEMVYLKIMKDEKLGKFRKSPSSSRLLQMIKNRFYTQPQRIPSMEGIQYPIGWSKEGSFAYIIKRVRRGRSPGGYEFIIRWWKTGEVVASIFWETEKTDTFDKIWKKNYDVIAKQLDRFRIVQFSAFDTGSGTIKINDISYSIGFGYMREVATVRKDCEWGKRKVISKKSVRLLLSSFDDNLVIPSSNIKGYLHDIDGLVSLSVNRIILSPFGNYAAVLVDYRALKNRCPGSATESTNYPYASLNIVQLK